MQKEIVIPVLVALLASGGTWLATKTSDTLTLVERQNIADQVKDDAFVKTVASEVISDPIFIAKLKSDEDFRGDVGIPGTNGKNGVSPSPEDVAIILKGDSSFLDTIKPIKVETGSVYIGTDDTDFKPKKCTSTDRHYRGKIKQRVNFKKPFDNPPSVSVGIKTFDILDRIEPGVRLHFLVDKIDREGFVYTFMTWCSAIVYSANGDWIAIGR